MKTTVRYILMILAGVVILGAMTVAVMLGKAGRQPLKCTGLNVVITDSLENDFVSKNDVKVFLDREYGQYVGLLADSLDLARMEDIIDGRSAVKKSEAYITKDGMLNIKVSQRKPAVRFQKAEGGFYADEEGFVFPLQSSYASHVQIIDGDIPINMKSGHKGMIEDPEEREWFRKAISIVNYIDESKVWKDKIVQIHVSNGGELTLVPREGNEIFIFGQPVRIEEKFDMMEKYYTAIRHRKGGEKYEVVNVEYEGQIVCR